jgi:hypothetical protein
MKREPFSPLRQKLGKLSEVYSDCNVVVVYSTSHVENQIMLNTGYGNVQGITQMCSGHSPLPRTGEYVESKQNNPIPTNGNNKSNQ